MAADVIINPRLFPDRHVYIGTNTLTFGAATTTKSFTLEAWGIGHTIDMTVADFTNSVTATLSITKPIVTGKQSK